MLMKKKKLSKKEIEEIAVFKKAIKYIEKGYGKQRCEEINFKCASCLGGLLLGLLNDHIDLIKY